jgi:hypothetical protein
MWKALRQPIIELDLITVVRGFEATTFPDKRAPVR